MTTAADEDTSTTPAVGDLTFDEQAALTAGADMWHTNGVDRLGVVGIGLTDGPSGARGTQFSGTVSASLPCGAALASTWNRDLIGRVGRLLGDEARSKDTSVLLAPTINIQRHPLGGRNFECASEDPYLTAEIAVAFIEGVQSRGVACAVKHYAFNDQETDRNEIDVVIDERTRREIYLPPFEAAVRRAGVWAVMAAYNRVDGRYVNEHRELLTDILRDEWGFDGVVMSDWFGTHSTAALAAGLDLEMPGPALVLGEHLGAAVEAGDVTTDAVAAAAGRVLAMIERTTSAQRPLGDPASAAEASEIARAAATEAIVLLANDGVLPLDASSDPRIALIGWRADQPLVQGGGSAQVTPPYVVTPLRGLTGRAGDDAIVFEAGREVPGSVAIGGRLLADEGSDAPGVRVEYFAAGDLSGECLRTEVGREATAMWIGEPAPGVRAGDFSARLTATICPDVSGAWTLSLAGVGTARLFLDGEPLVGDPSETTGAGPLGLLMRQVEATVVFDAGATYEVTAEIDAFPAEGPIALTGITVEARPPAQPDAPERAVQAARDADVAVVVVAHDVAESEGLDSPTMDLPGDQIDLVGRVAAVNPRTVVVVNAASAVSMDWADEVAAVVQMSYLGQEAGNALAAVLFGDADASGRLTSTHPRRIEDAPAHGNFPGGDGTVSYAEGIFVGYRHYDSRGVEPRWCFGHGLSYTTFEYSPLEVAADPSDASRVTVSVDVANTGERAGLEVVQVYVRPLDGAGSRPDRELRAFEKVTLDAGATTTVTLTLDERAFAYWDTATHAWRAPAGDYEILVGSSSRAIHRTATWNRSPSVATGS